MQLRAKETADSSAALRNDKQKNKQMQKQMQGFFAALRMTTRRLVTDLG
jgi:hypothetical protein